MEILSEILLLSFQQLSFVVPKASSSGNSSTSITTQIKNSGLEGDLNNQANMDQRKRKRMQSNRESARRSRMRKQQQLDGLMDQVKQLKEDNSLIMTAVTITNQKYLNVESESSILRAQMGELSHRLQSLNEIINYMSGNQNSNILPGHFVDGMFGVPGIEYDSIFDEHSWFTNPLKDIGSSNLGYFNQPIIASADIFPY